LAKGQRNVRAALERIIEHAGEMDVTASAVLAAIQAYSKINPAGQWIDRTEQISLNELFDRMSTQELEEIGANGKAARSGLRRQFKMGQLPSNRSLTNGASSDTMFSEDKRIVQSCYFCMRVGCAMACDFAANF
jgi:hypothetical protein